MNLTGLRRGMKLRFEDRIFTLLNKCSSPTDASQQGFKPFTEKITYKYIYLQNLFFYS